MSGADVTAPWVNIRPLIRYWAPLALAPPANSTYPLTEVKEVFEVAMLLILVIPPLGLYDIWQVIVRRWPSTFYSSSAQQKIAVHYPNTFTSGKLITLSLAVIWICGPLLLFLAYVV